MRPIRPFKLGGGAKTGFTPSAREIDVAMDESSPDSDSQDKLFRSDEIAITVLPIVAKVIPATAQSQPEEKFFGTSRWLCLKDPSASES